MSDQRYRLSRRVALTGVAGAGLLAATSRFAGAQDATPAPAFPVTITTQTGDAVIDARPERVIALSFPDVDTVIELGVLPVGMQRDPYAESGISPWFTETVMPDEVPFLAIAGDLSIEEIVALDPDLILDTLGFTSAPVFEQLSAIAPTVSGLPAGTIDSLTVRTQIIGSALGLAELAEEKLAEANDAIDSFAVEFPQLAGKTVAYGYVRSTDNIGVIIGEEHFSAQLFQRWGLSLAPGLADVPSTGGGMGQISWELIELLEADILLLGFNGEGLREELEASPIFQTLKVVQSGNFYPLTQSLTVALQVPSIANIGWSVEQLAPMFVDLASGDASPEADV